jgi:transposase
MEAPSLADHRGRLRVANTLVTNKEETARRFYTKQHPYDCGIDLHTRTMYVCILDQAGETLVHRHMKATPEALLKAIAPYRDQLVIAAEWMLTWDWLADLCADQGIPGVLGHARSMPAIHGGKAKNDTIDAHTIAVLLRGGMLPQASVYPRAMRATRALRHRRPHLARQRGALLAHVQHTNSPDHLPAIGQKIAYHANRDGVTARLTDPAVHTSLDVDLARIGDDAARRRDRERTLVSAAKHHDAHTLYRLRTVPGLGTILSRVWRSEIHDLERGPRVQEFASSGRLVTCAKASAGKRSGTSGTTIGHAHLQWAFSEAAVLCLRDHPAGQKFLARLEQKQRTGNALTILAPQLARAVYDMFKRNTAFDMHTVLQAYGRGVGAPNASLDRHGMSRFINARPCVKPCVCERRCAYRL